MCNSNREQAEKFRAEVLHAANAISGDCPRLAALAEAGASFYGEQIASGERTAKAAKTALAMDMIDYTYFTGRETVPAKYGVDLSAIPECGSVKAEPVGTPFGDVYLV